MDTPLLQPLHRLYQQYFQCRTRPPQAATSIVITNWQRPEALRRCLQSVAAVPLPIVVSSAAITPAVCAELSAFLQQRPDTVLTVQTVDHGCNEMWLRGVYAAQTPYVLLLHDDDQLAPQFSQAYTAHIAPVLGTVHHAFWDGEVAVDGQPIGERHASLAAGQTGLQPGAAVVADRLQRGLALSPVVQIFQRRLALRVLQEAVEHLRDPVFYTRPTMLVGNDMLLSLRHAEAWPQCYYLAESLTYYGRWDGSETERLLNAAQRPLQKAYAATKQYFKQYPRVVLPRKPRTVCGVQLPELSADSCLQYGVTQVFQQYCDSDLVVCPTAATGSALRVAAEQVALPEDHVAIDTRGFIVPVPRLVFQHKMKGPDMLRLFCQYYKDKSPARQAELDLCLELNATNPAITECVVLVEADAQLPAVAAQASHVIPLTAAALPGEPHPSGRPTFSQMVLLAKQYCDRSDPAVAQRTVSILANSDIYFDESLYACLGMADDVFYALGRYDLLDGKRQLWDVPVGQDSWIFRGTPAAIAADFPFGYPGCDNRFAYQALSAGYTVQNPARSIIATHVHTSQVRNYPANTVQDLRCKDRVPPPYLHVCPAYLGQPPAYEIITTLADIEAKVATKTASKPPQQRRPVVRPISRPSGRVPGSANPRRR